MPQLMVSFHGLHAPRWVLDGIAAGRIAAVCLFAYNVESPAQVRELALDLRRAAREGGQDPPLIGLDQEGGQMMAVGRGATELPGNMALGATRSVELSYQAGAVLGAELLALGCNLNFAPVLDLAGRLESAVVGARSFGDDPVLAGSLGASLIRGMQSGGALATAKHFPGHGDTALDSHFVAPTVSRSRSQLDAAELVPFRAAIEAGVAAVMSAHVRYTALEDRPATLSPAILTTLLRDELGYGGLAITDAMDMKAVADAPAEVRARQAIEAGADLVMLGHLPEQAELIGRLEPDFRRDSLERIARARAGLSWEIPDLSTLGSKDHLRLAQEIADRAVTIVRGGDRLPFELQSDEQLGLVVVETPDLSPADSSASVELQLGRQLQARHRQLKEVRLPREASATEIAAVANILDGCSAVIVGTVNAVQDPGQEELLRLLSGRPARVAHLALRSPADAMITPDGVPTVCSYGIRAVNTEAAVKVLFGEIAARGVLPVSLPEKRAGTQVSARG